MPITFDHLAKVVTARRFTPDEEAALNALTQDERDRLIAHAHNRIRAMLAEATPAGSA